MSHRRTESSSSASHLSPFDYSGVGMGFGLYRPRRPSYTFATQVQRQRSESYRYAVRKSTSDLEEPADFIEGIIQRKNRKESYIRATRPGEKPDVELRELKEHMRRVEEETEAEVAHYPVSCPTSPIILINDERAVDMYPYNNHTADDNSSPINASETRNGQTKNSIPKAFSENHIKELKEVVEKKRFSPKIAHVCDNHSTPTDSYLSNDCKTVEDPYDDSVFVSTNDGREVTTPSSVETPSFPSPFRRIRLRKNFILLCASFILVFSAFRAVQNLQSSLNSEGYLGILSLVAVHGTMVVTCLWAPVFINTLTAKWTLVIGVFSYILWIAANFYPRFYTLIPLGIFAGIGKGILWTAESSYMVKLAYDYSRVTKEGFEREMFRFHGIFLACFQTTHIFGNLFSSLVLQNSRELETLATLNAHTGSQSPFEYDDNMTVMYGDDPGGTIRSCGVLFPNKAKYPYSGTHNFIHKAKFAGHTFSKIIFFCNILACILFI